MSGNAKHALISHPFRGVLGLIPFPKANYFDVLFDNSCKVEQKVEYKESQLNKEAGVSDQQGASDEQGISDEQGVSAEQGVRGLK